MEIGECAKRAISFIASLRCAWILTNKCGLPSQLFRKDICLHRDHSRIVFQLLLPVLALIGINLALFPFAHRRTLFLKAIPIKNMKIKENRPSPNAATSTIQCISSCLPNNGSMSRSLTDLDQLINGSMLAEDNASAVQKLPPKSTTLRQWNNRAASNHVMIRTKKGRHMLRPKLLIIPYINMGRYWSILRW